MDLSWPEGASINDGVDGECYLGGGAHIKLPTVQFMEDRILELGPGAYLYKIDLARGYRQLRVDPTDWPLLGFQHQGRFYLDMCPPFGLRTSTLFMQRTTEAISHIHGQRGYLSKPYLDDFGGAEATLDKADDALDTLQNIMGELGIVEATKKVCRPAHTMIWLGILFNTVDMTMQIPRGKMVEIQGELAEWVGRQRATQREMQRLLGLLQFVATHFHQSYVREPEGGAAQGDGNSLSRVQNGPTVLHGHVAELQWHPNPRQTTHPVPGRTGTRRLHYGLRRVQRDSVLQ